MAQVIPITLAGLVVKHQDILAWPSGSKWIDADELKWLIERVVDRDARLAEIAKVANDPLLPCYVDHGAGHFSKIRALAGALEASEEGAAAPMEVRGQSRCEVVTQYADGSVCTACAACHAAACDGFCRARAASEDQP
jgi:hypothetical protein